MGESEPVSEVPAEKTFYVDHTSMTSVLKRHAGQKSACRKFHAIGTDKPRGVILLICALVLATDLIGERLRLNVA
jgi:hypothetical protein